MAPGNRLEAGTRRDLRIVERTLQSMTLREKVGQLFIVRLEALIGSYSSMTVKDLNTSGVLILDQEMVDFDRKYPVGGIAIYGKNIRNPKQIRQLTSDIHTKLCFDPLVCVDEEGGRIARLANTDSMNLKRFPNMKEIASRRHPRDAFKTARYIGTYLKEYGFDVTFAPVADLNTNPQDTVIAPRTFGSDPALAAKFVSNYVRGLARAGVASCLKHYPGQGDVEHDTHENMRVFLRKNWDDLKNCELIPFRAGMKAGASMVMAAHTIAINADTSLWKGMHVPVSLSKFMLEGRLRGEFGYKGIIISDGLDMNAIILRYPLKSATLMALEAGTDIILLPYDYKVSFDAVVSAVERGDLPEERIDRSVRKILLLKRRLRK